jgi:hypothetical protein
MDSRSDCIYEWATLRAMVEGMVKHFAEKEAKFDRLTEELAKSDANFESIVGIHDCQQRLEARWCGLSAKAILEQMEHLVPTEKAD